MFFSLFKSHRAILNLLAKAWVSLNIVSLWNQSYDIEGERWSFALGHNDFVCSCFLSAKTRQGALDGLKTAMATRILYEFISERRMTITDSIERCLKKGTRWDDETVFF